MTKVLCSFSKCHYAGEMADEDLYVCEKDEIWLDDRVEGLLCGCPNSEWDLEEEEE